MRICGRATWQTTNGSTVVYRWSSTDLQRHRWRAVAVAVVVLVVVLVAAVEGVVGPGLVCRSLTSRVPLRVAAI